LGQPFHLLVGELEADLRFQLPFDRATWPDRLTLLRDGWRIDQICLYRPLIYYSVFREAEYIEQFAISLRSLIEFGCYQGPIVVLTDHLPQSLGGSCRPTISRALPCCQSGPATERASWRCAISFSTGRTPRDSSPSSMSTPIPSSTAM
jgi:hypothetical protein